MREFANLLYRETCKAGASLRILERLTKRLESPYGKTTIGSKLNGEREFDWEFVAAIVLACGMHAGRKPDLEHWHREFDRMNEKLGHVRNALALNGQRLPDADRRLAVARSLYLGGEEVRLDDLPGAQKIVASWRRCGRETAHLKVDFAGEPDPDIPLVRYGQPVVDRLLDKWPGPPVCAILAGPDVVIYTQKTTDTSLQLDLRRHNLAPGFRYDERNAATNGLGTALATRDTAYVVGPAHLAEELQDDACAASVIIDPRTNGVAGIFNLTCRRRDANPYLEAMATMTAGWITAELRGDRAAQ